MQWARCCVVSSVAVRYAASRSCCRGTARLARLLLFESTPLFPSQAKRFVMTPSKNLLAVIVLGLSASTALAQSSAPAASASAPVADVWTHKVKRLDRAAVDSLLAKPEKL